jgi:hypothetical protein
VDAAVLLHLRGVTEEESFAVKSGTTVS